MTQNYKIEFSWQNAYKDKYCPLRWSSGLLVLTYYIYIFDENLSALSAFLELDSGKALVTL